MYPPNLPNLLRARIISDTFETGSNTYITTSSAYRNINIFFKHANRYHSTLSKAFSASSKITTSGTSMDAEEWIMFTSLWIFVNERHPKIKSTGSSEITSCIVVSRQEARVSSSLLSKSGLPNPDYKGWDEGDTYILKETLNYMHEVILNFLFKIRGKKVSQRKPLMVNIPITNKPINMNKNVHYLQKQTN